MNQNAKFMNGWIGLSASGVFDRPGGLGGRGFFLSLGFLEIQQGNVGRAHLGFGRGARGTETLVAQDFVIDVSVALEHLLHDIDIGGDIEHVFLMEGVDLLLAGGEHHIHAADRGLAGLVHFIIGNAALLHGPVLGQHLIDRELAEDPHHIFAAGAAFEFAHRYAPAMLMR